MSKVIPLNNTAFLPGLKALCAASILFSAAQAQAQSLYGTALTISPAGGMLPYAVTPAGGVVVDLIGINGTRIVSEAAPNTLLNSTTTHGLNVIGTQTGFTSTLMGSLGGGISKASIRITLDDGDTGPGEQWAPTDYLAVNGINVALFASVNTTQTDSLGTTITATNMSGFQGSVVDTGFFSLSAAADLAALFTSLQTTGSLSFVMGSSGGNVVNFTSGVTALLKTTSMAPTIVPLVTPILLQNASPVSTPINSDYAVQNQVLTGGSANRVNSLTFSAGSSLYITTGTLTLTSGVVNSQVGDSALNGGTLAANSAGITFNADGNLQVGSIIDTPGTVAKNGLATITLTGENTYTGVTAVHAGILQVGNGVAGSISTSSSATIDAGAALVFNMAGTKTVSFDIANNGAVQSISPDNTTFSGAISGSGSLSQAGTGITVLSGVNTYSGPTIVSKGVLSIGDGSSGTISAASAVSVSSGATLVLDSPDTNLLSHGISNDGKVVFYQTPFAASYTFTGAIAGAGTLVKSNTNTLILSGSNSYSDATTIEEGTLRLGSASALPQQSAVQVNTGATLDLSAVSQTLGSITGSGSVITGSSTLTRIGANNSSTTFTGVISGSGDVEKMGVGTWTLTAANTYTGSTTITVGSILVNGSIQSNVAVGSAGLLGGGGTINGNVTNAGTVSPGNSPGVLTIAGNYNQTGALLIQIASHSSYDQLVVGGTATLGGSLVVSASSYKLRGAPFSILTAGGGVNGTFADISSASLLRLNVIYDANSVLLQSAYRYFGDIPGMTANESAVAAALDHMLDTDEFYKSSRLVKLGDYLNALPTAKIPAALEQIVPSDYITLADTSFALAQVQASNLERRMEEIRSGLVDFTADTSAPSTFYTSSAQTRGDGMRYIGTDGRELTPTPIERCWGFFLNGSGEFVDDKNSTIAGDGKFNTSGISTGADYRFNDHVAAGLTAGYANTTTHGRGDGTVGIDSGDISAYATAFNNGYFVNGILGVASSNYSVRRESLEGTAHGDTSGTSFHALLGGGYSYNVGGFSGGPIASLRYSSVNIDGVTESGSLAPLNIHSQSKSSMKTTAGFQVAYEIPTETMVIKPQAKVQWRHEFANDCREVEANFIGADSSPFTVSGPALGSDSMLVDLGATVQINAAVSVYGFYSADIGSSNYSSNAVFGGMQLSF